MVKPFTHDPSATAAFAALSDRDLAGLPQYVSTAPGNHGERAPMRPIRAVVIGGGTGAPVSIRTLLSLGFSTSAVVAMADDGGSTGILREEADVTPPGDVRKCIAAMAANPNDPLTRAFKYRFSFARNHTLGNLMLSALEDAAGSFPEAIAICERLLSARGHVYPSTLSRVTLDAVTCDGQTLRGQAVACHSGTALSHVWLRSPDRIEPYPSALQAIREADLIVLGPGSLFTSIIPNLLVPGIIDAIRQSAGAVVFVCSLADMQGETWGLTAAEHVQALMNHGMRGLVDYVLVHTEHPLRSPGMGHAEVVDADVTPATDLQLSGGVRPVRITHQDARAIQAMGAVVIARNLVDPVRPTWHDPAALQDAFLGVLKLCRSRRM
ncbi:gluconeogenesis factor YvcK family protein [Adlercreutzia sp. ZJ141]|uniref:gluconeogenesis factor YvcK family protein n=1 Tax=Adlercreutzia sp. ZJ141 TaxID=2709406 RepID=UPI0013EA79CC|nr:gluconeogenesis factor YvcK family protein [Adlercreutzia sp. ZJ141]